MKSVGTIKHERNTKVYNETVARFEKEIHSYRKSIIKWDNEGRDYSRISKLLRKTKEELAKYKGEFVEEFTHTSVKQGNGTYLVTARLGLYTLQRVLSKEVPIFEDKAVWYCDNDQCGSLKGAKEYAIEDLKREFQLL